MSSLISLKDAERQVRADKRAAVVDDTLITEDRAAAEFAEEHGEYLRFCHSTGSWFRWSSVSWRRDETGMTLNLARIAARRMAAMQDDRKRFIVSKTAFAAAIERFARVDPKMAVAIDYWDSDPMLLGTPGGTVDLRTGELRDSDPNDGITKITNVPPLNQGCPRWLQFLDEATGGDADLIRFLQQWCGYCLTGATREHALVFVYGPGGNGKSVFINIVTWILGGYAKTAVMDTFTASHSDKHSTDIAMLRGARLVTASETEEGRAWAESRIKQMTGGDPVTARFMRQDNFTFLPQFKLTIVGNHAPILRNVDDAARRRFNIIPFNRSPATPDRELQTKLEAEAPGILQWMIAGCLDWQANGLTPAATVTAATAEYFSDQDLIAQWLEECCDRGARIPALWDTAGNLFESWTEFATKAGENPGKQKAFGMALQRRGIERHRGSGGVRGFRDIRVRPSWGDA